MVHQVTLTCAWRSILLIVLSGACAPDEDVDPGAASGRRSEPITPPLVLFISVDTLRVDFLGCYGNPWIETPHLDALARRSVVMTEYTTVVPTTLASHASMFTGKYPSRHGAPRNAFTLPDLVTTLPEVLKANGYHTSGVIAASPLQHTFNFHQGFERFDDNEVPKSAELVVDRALGLLDTRPVDKPTFLFLHFWDPHQSYEAQQPWYGRYLRDVEDENVASWGPLARATGDEMRDDMLRYASEVSYVDAQIGRLLAELDVRDLKDEALIVFTSDHGEGFGDHPPFTLHGDHVYQEQIHVPCLLKFPAGVEVPASVEGVSASIDLMPTLLNALGLPIPGDLDGEVAFSVWGPASSLSEGTSRFCEATVPHLGLKPHPIEEGTKWLNERKRRCVRQGNYKYVFYPFDEMIEGGTGMPQLFDVTADPDEVTNLIEIDVPAYRSLVGRLHAELMDWTFNRPGIEASISEDMSPADIKALEALGYL